jgi:hypothetical protein
LNKILILIYYNASGGRYQCYRTKFNPNYAVGIVDQQNFTIISSAQNGFGLKE